MMTLDVTLTATATDATYPGTLTASRAAEGRRVILHVVPCAANGKPQLDRAVDIGFANCDELRALAVNLVRLAESFGAK